MKAHRDRHHFTQTQARLSPPLAPPLADQVLLSDRLKPQTEVVKITEQRYNLHNENLLGEAVLVALTTVLKRSLVSYPLRRTQV
jgi:hypothetical protein